GFAIKFRRLARAFLSAEPEVERSLLQGVVGRQIVVRRRSIGFRRCPQKLDLVLLGYRCRDLALNGEDILQVAIVRFGPDGASIGRIDQLGDNTHAIALFAHAAFEQVRHSQLFANGPAIVGLSLKKNDELRPMILSPGILARTAINSSERPSEK